MLIFCDVTAVAEDPWNVPKKFVAVTAVALTFPENTSAVNTFVLGLYCKPASLDKATPDPVAFNEKTIE